MQLVLWEGPPCFGLLIVYSKCLRGHLAYHILLFACISLLNWLLIAVNVILVVAVCFAGSD